MKKISYAELVKNENLILCNNITNLGLDLYCGSDYDEENDDYYNIYQYYLIDQGFADYLARATDEIVYYCDELDLYVWGVTHFGTPWNGVYLNVKTFDEMCTDGTYD